MKKIKKLYHRIFNSIAFYPIIIVIVFTLTSFLMVYIENTELSDQVKKNFTWAIIESETTAGLILGTIATGLFSLMVFSFSMVMIVLNQAASSFSPRLLPGLITQKTHQLVLGFYLGTIFYTFVLMFNIRSKESGYKIPGIGIFFDVCFLVLCLIMFVYFIHSISTSIQVGTILNRLYKKTLKQLTEEIKKEDNEKNHHDPEADNWYLIPSPESGYIQSITKLEMVKACEKHDLKIKMQIALGRYVIKGTPIMLVNKTPEKNSEWLKELENHLIFYKDEYVEENYLYGFKQLTEIAVKALSPGINDPGTALNAIDYLSDLFANKLKINEYEYIYDSNDQVRIVLDKVSLDDLMYTCLTPIREYGKRDVIILEKLILSLKSLILYSENDYRNQKILASHIQTIIEDAGMNIKNTADINRLNLIIKELNRMTNDGIILPLLEKESI